MFDTAGGDRKRGSKGISMIMVHISHLDCKMSPSWETPGSNVVLYWYYYEILLDWSLFHWVKPYGDH